MKQNKHEYLQEITAEWWLERHHAAAVAIKRSLTERGVNDSIDSYKKISRAILLRPLIPGQYFERYYSGWRAVGRC